MKVLAVRSVPLSKETRDAWKTSGVLFAKRTRTGDSLVRIVRNYAYDAVLNLGTIGVVPAVDVDIWNEDETVRAVSRTATLRETLDGFGMPEHTHEGSHWHKHGGFGGVGVEYYEDHTPNCGWRVESQQHIEGTEYRVITVGDKVVQASKKVNCEWINGKHHFDYEWVGVDGIRTSGIIPTLKTAVERIPSGGRSVLGWDCIVSDRAYILECNTSPGVNEPTAQRIVKAIGGEG